MSEDWLLATCPACGDEDAHTILRNGPNNTTVQCEECGHVHTVSPASVRLIELDLVLSDGDRSWTDVIRTPKDEEIATGTEFELDGHRFLVTGIEGKDGTKVAKPCKASMVGHLYAKLFDTVPVKIAVNEGRITKSSIIRMDPDDRVAIGEVLDVEGRAVVVKTLKSARNKMVRKGSLPARDIRRAFCDPA